MRSTVRRFLFALLAALSASSTAAQVFPAYLNYQGKLGDPTGSPLTGTYSFRFRLYDQASGGSLLFTDANYTGGNAVSVVNGVYSVQIGSLTAGGIPPSVFFNSEVWLEIDVSPGANFTGAETLTPRERLATSPFAFRAAYAEHLGAGGVAVATFTTGGVLQLPYGVTAATASFTNTSGFSLTASSGVNVAAGGVYAPFFSGTHYGDGSHLSGIAPGESNTYASSKTFISDVLIAGTAKLAASSATFTYGVTAATFTASSSMTASAFFGDGAGITFGAPSGGIYSRFNANGSLSMAQDRGITLTGCSGGGVALGGGGAVVDCNGLHLPNGAFNNTNTIDNSGSGAGTAGSHLVVSAGAGNGSGESGGRIYLGGQDSSGQNASVQINAPGANGVIALANTSDPKISWSGTQKVGIGTAGPANKLSVAGNADVSGLFGVGTTAPATTLEVAGSASFGSGAAKSTFTAAGGLFLASGSSATLSGANGFITSASSVTASAFFGDGSHLSGIPTAAGIAAAYVAKAGDTMTGQLTLSGSTLTVTGSAFSVSSPTFVITGGNVGIGTASPAAKLHLYTTSGNNTESIQDTNASGFTALQLYSDVDQSYLLYGGSSYSGYAGAKALNLIAGGGPIAFFNTATEAMRITTGGNVGIGTANPAGKLHVSSSTLFVDGTGAAVNVAGGSVTASAFFGDGSHLSGIPSASNFVAKAGDSMTGPLTMLSASTITVSGNAFSVGVTTLVVNGGNVGVGLAGPQRRLHVFGALDTVTTQLVGQASTAGGLFTTLALTKQNAGPFVAGSGPRIGFGLTTESGGTVSAETLLGEIGAVREAADNTGALVFRPTSGGTATEAMRITSAGSVGISTASPVLPLDVNGAAQFGSGATRSTFTALGGLFIASGSSLTLSGANGFLTSASSISASAFFGDGSHLSGIPTNGGIASSYVAKTGDTMTGQLTLSGSTLTVTGNAFSVSSPTFVITGGNVGIGATNPAVKLHIQGGGPDAGSLVVQNTATGGRAWQWAVGDNSYGPAGGLYARDWTGGSIMMSVLPSGNVGIGSIGPASRLHVSSGVVTVDGTGAGVLVAGGSVTASAFFGDGSHMTGLLSTAAANAAYVAKAGDTMTGQLTLSGSTLTVTGNAFSVGGSTFVVSGGRVSLGGAGAGASLDILGTSGLTAFRVMHQSAGDTSFATGVNGDSFLRYAFLPDGTMKWGSGSASNDVQLYRPTTRSLAVAPIGGDVVNAFQTIASGGAVVFDVDTANQRVGIGTQNPATKLHLSSGVMTLDGTGAGLTLTNTAVMTANSTVTFNSQANFANVASSQAVFAGYSAAGGASPNSGTILLGSASVGARLDVNGPGGTLYVDNMLDQTNTQIDFRLRTANASPDTVLFLGGSSGLAPVGKSGGNGATSIMADGRLYVGGNGVTTSSLSVVGGVVTMPSGPVGIGTANPAAKLHMSSGTLLVDGTSPAINVAGGSVTASAFFGDGSHLTGIPTSAGVAAAYVAKTGDSMSGQLTIAGSSLTVISNAASSPLVVSTTTNLGTGNAALYVDGANNVGVWTTHPAAGLTIGDSWTNSGTYPYPNLFLAGNSGSIAKALITGKWQSSNLWGIGPFSTGADNTIRLGNVDSATGTWSASQNINLMIGGLNNENNLGMLDVSGTNPTVIVHDYNSGNGNAYFRLGKDYNDWKGGFVDYDGVNNLLNIGVHNTADTTLANDFNAISVVRSNGNVGIGTGLTAAAATLHVSSAATSGTTLLMEISSGTAAGQQLMVVQANGSVGIGTTNPAAKLHMSSGTLTVDGTGGAINVAVGSVTASAFFGDGSHLSGIPTNSSIASTYVAKAGDTMTGQLTLSGSTLTVTGNAFSVGASTFVVNGGNVGIGTVSPSTKLDVNNSVILSESGSNSSGVQVNGGAGWDTIVFRSSAANTGDTFYISQSDSSKQIYMTTPATNYDWRMATALNAGRRISLWGSTISFVSADTPYDEEMTIRNDKVGIGTTAPDEKLAVNGAVRAESNAISFNGASGALVDWYPAGNQARIVATRNGGVGQSSMTFNTYNGSAYVDAMDILPNGNVGIGTANPGRTFEVAGNVGIKINANAGGNAQLTFAQATTDKAYLTYWNGSGTLAMTSGSGTDGVQFNPSTGYVGIGMNSPATKLHMSSGTLTIDGNVATSLMATGSIGINTQGAPAEKFHLNGGNIRLDTGVLILNNNSLSEIDFKDGSMSSRYWLGTDANGFAVNDRTGAGAEVFRIKNGGNVGIGTVNPATKLHMSSGTLLVDGTSPAIDVAGGSVTASAFFGDGSHLAGILSTTSANATYVAKTGDTMTGSLVISAASADMSLQATSGSSILRFKNPSNTQIGWIQEVAASSTTQIDGEAAGGQDAVALAADGINILHVSNANPTGYGVYVTSQNGTNFGGFLGSGAFNVLNNSFSVGTSTFIVRGGSVGVGRAPVYNGALEVYSGDNNGIFLNNSTNANQITFYSNSTGQGNIPVINITKSGGSGWVIGDLGTSLDFIDVSEASAFNFRTNLGKTRLKIDGAGNVGVGTASPAATLHVSSAATSGTTLLMELSSGTAAGQQVMVVQANGKVGMGTASPGYPLHLKSDDPSAIFIEGIAGNPGITFKTGSTADGINFQDNSGTPVGSLQNASAAMYLGSTNNIILRAGGGPGGAVNRVNVNSNGYVGIGLDSPSALLHLSSAATSGTTLLMEASSGTASGQQVMVLQANGSMGLGTTSPTAQLHISSAGNLNATNNLVLVTTGSTPTNLFRVQANGNVYALGSFNGGGADVAEMYPASAGIEAGDVVAFGPDGKLVRFGESRGAVLGIVSTRPGTVLGWDVSKSEMPDQRPVALTGRVPVKATLENGPIRRGDALSAASRPGFAKKARDGESTIGLALEDFDASRGTVMCFVRIGENAAGELKSLRRENEELRRQIDELREIVRARRK